MGENKARKARPRYCEVRHGHRSTGRIHGQSRPGRERSSTPRDGICTGAPPRTVGRFASRHRPYYRLLYFNPKAHAQGWILVQSRQFSPPSRPPRPRNTYADCHRFVLDFPICSQCHWPLSVTGRILNLRNISSGPALVSGQVPEKVIKRPFTWSRIPPPPSAAAWPTSADAGPAPYRYSDQKRR